MKKPDREPDIKLYTKNGTQMSVWVIDSMLYYYHFNHGLWSSDRVSVIKRINSKFYYSHSEPHSDDDFEEWEQEATDGDIHPKDLEQALSGFEVKLEKILLSDSE